MASDWEMRQRVCAEVMRRISLQSGGEVIQRWPRLNSCAKTAGGGTGPDMVIWHLHRLLLDVFLSQMQKPAFLMCIVCIKHDLIRELIIATSIVFTN